MHKNISLFLTWIPRLFVIFFIYLLFKHLLSYFIDLGFDFGYTVEYLIGKRKDCYIMIKMKIIRSGEK